MDVLGFRNALKAKVASHATCNSYTHHTFKAMSWAYEAGLTTSNPVHGMKRLPQSRECATFRRRALTEKEIPQFLAAAEADDEEFRKIEALREVRRIPQTPLWIGFLETGGAAERTPPADLARCRLRTRGLDPSGREHEVEEDASNPSAGGSSRPASWTCGAPGKSAGPTAATRRARLSQPAGTVLDADFSQTDEDLQRGHQSSEDPARRRRGRQDRHPCSAPHLRLSPVSSRRGPRLHAQSRPCGHATS